MQYLKFNDPFDLQILNLGQMKKIKHNVIDDFTCILNFKPIGSYLWPVAMTHIFGVT